MTLFCNSTPSFFKVNSWEIVKQDVQILKSCFLQDQKIRSQFVQPKKGTRGPSTYLFSKEKISNNLRKLFVFRFIECEHPVKRLWFRLQNENFKSATVTRLQNIGMKDFGVINFDDCYRFEIRYVSQLPKNRLEVENWWVRNGVLFCRNIPSDSVFRSLKPKLRNEKL